MRLDLDLVELLAQVDYLFFQHFLMDLELLDVQLQRVDLLLLLLNLDRHFVFLHQPLRLVFKSCVSGLLEFSLPLLDDLFFLLVVVLFNFEHVFEDADVFHVRGQLLLVLLHLLLQKHFHVLQDLDLRFFVLLLAIGFRSELFNRSIFYEGLPLNLGVVGCWH